MKYCSLPAEASSKSTLISLLKEALEAEEVPTKTLRQILIVAEELFINIVHYAYTDSGLVDFYFEIDNEARQIEMRFQDTGIPFNPLTHSAADISLSSEEREIGGMGILMVKNMVDFLEYRFENETNILYLKKSF